jgi:hypothetical protein
MTFPPLCRCDCISHVIAGSAATKQSRSSAIAAVSVLSMEIASSLRSSQ